MIWSGLHRLGLAQPQVVKPWSELCDSGLQRSRRHMSHSMLAFMRDGHWSQRVDRGAIAFDGTDIEVAFSGGKASGLAAAAQIRVNQRSDVLVTPMGFEPERMQALERPGRHPKGAPHPVRLWPAGLYLYLGDALTGGDDRVESPRLIDRKQEERELILRQQTESGHREPHRVWRADQHVFVVAHDV